MGEFFGLEIGWELEEMLTLGSVLVSLLLLVWSAKSVLPKQVKTLYLLALGFLPLYLNWKLFLEGGAYLSDGDLFSMWFRHLFFYLGQLFFFLFIVRLVSTRFASEGKTLGKGAKAVLTALFVFFLTLPVTGLAYHTVHIFEREPTPKNLLLFITDQGVQHILAILFFFLTLAIIRTQVLLLNDGKLRTILYRLFAANGLFILVHIWEYLAESLHLLPFLPEEPIEIIEYGFQFAALIMFYHCGRMLSKSAHV